MFKAVFCPRVLAAALSFAVLTPLGVSAQDQNPSSAQPTQTLQKIVVTGSRIPRSQKEGQAPVTVVTGAQIKAQGYTTLHEFLDSIPQAASTDFASRPSTWGSTAVNARTLNLRGLDPDHTLLLVNGIRMVDYPQAQNGGGEHYSFQNYANIPTGMIDRVEILPTGASAIYGSDAVAGVVNVILKKEYQGDDLQVQVGGATRGGRKFGDINFLGGHSGDKWHVVYNLEHTNRSPLWGSDRPWTDSEADAGYGVWSPSARMFGYHTYDAISLYDVNGNYVTPPAGSCNQFPNFALGHYQTIATSGDEVTGPVTDHGYYCTQPALFRNWVLTPGLRSNDGYIAGEYDLSNNLQLYASAGLWDTVGTSNTELPFLYPMGGLPNNFYDKTTGQIITNYLRQLTKAELGYAGNTQDREQYWDIRAGLRGGLFDNRFSWDFSLDSQKYIVHEDYTGLNEQGMFDFFFGPQLGTTVIDGTTYPVYALNADRYWNPITPAEYSTFGVAGTNSAYTTMQQATFTVNGDLFDIPWDQQPVGWAAVLEGNQQTWTLNPDPRGNTTTFGDPFQDYNSGAGSRTRYAFGTEFRIPLFSTFTWDISGRADKYNDASSADVARTWGTGFEWRPGGGWLFRGGYGTNFHAPDMMAIYSNASASTVGIYADPLECIQTHDTTCQATQHSTYFTLYSNGGPNLVPETGHGWTYGFVWDIPGVEGLSVSADYWHLGVNNEIKWIGQDQVLTDEAGCLTGLTITGAPYTAHPIGSPYCLQAIADVKRDANGNILSVQTGPINEAQLYVGGIDASLDYGFETQNWGGWHLRIDYTDYLSYKERVLASDPLLNTRYQNVESKVTGSVNWKKGPWDATLYGLRWGGVRAPNYGGCEVLPNGIIPSVGDPQCTIYKENVPIWIIWSTAVGYRFNDRVKLTLNVSNIFDKVGKIPYYAGGFEFIPRNQGADYTGREVFLRLDYKID
ncbi:MAG TPA: TonB-dependent receptor [Rhodanobacteraceae bacterium]|nr:TonB-dependent receptor [Rhodanobacteraceae bacterium]